MQRIAPIFLMIFLTLFTSPVQTDMFEPSHSCYAPSKPYEFEDEWQLNRFKDEVEEFRSCIEDFVEEQNDAVRKHQDAAEEAIDDWNRFVDYELN